MSNPSKAEIAACIRTGMNYKQIAEKFNISTASISRIMNPNKNTSLNGGDAPVIDREDTTSRSTSFYKGSEAENYYLKKSLTDCEERLRKINTELIDCQSEARKYKSTADELQKKLDLFEERKSLEIEKILLENERNRKSLMDGLGDLMNNEKGQDILLGALKILGDFTGKRAIADKPAENEDISDNPVINAYLKKLAQQMELMNGDDLGKWVTVSISLSQPQSANALNTLFEKVQNTQHTQQ